MFLDSSTVDRLKELILVPGTHHHELFHSIKSRVDGDFYLEYDTVTSDRHNYLRSYAAVENALIYRLTDSVRYARQAYQLLHDMYTSGHEGTPTIPDLGSWEEKKAGSKALTYAFPGMAYGLCYDWCRDGWTGEQTTFVKDSLSAGLDDWEALFRWELYNMPNSNWVSVCRGTEMVMMLAAREEQIRADRYAHIKELLREHNSIAYGPSGYSYEGLGYIHYGVPFGLAAMLAARETGDHTLDVMFRGKSFWKMVMYAFSATPDRKHVMTSVDSDGAFGQGLFALLFPTVPGDSLPYYKFFYDRTLGIDSPGSTIGRYEQNRLGGVWGLILYPDSVGSADPSPEFDPVMADHEFGAYFFRNRWQDENDLLLSMMGKFVRHDYNGWNMAESFNFSAVASDTYFAGQTGKNYDPVQVSGLLVDGKAWGDHKKPHRDTGGLLSYSSSDSGAYLVLDGGEKYRNLGLDMAHRHFHVAFLGDTAAMITTLDTVSSALPRSLRWQLNVGRRDTQGDVQVSLLNEEGLPCFILHGNNGSFLKGWYMTPSETGFSGSDPLFLEPEASTGKRMMVGMWLGRGNPPVVSRVVRAGGDIHLYLDNSQSIHLLDDRIHYNAEASVTGTNTPGAAAMNTRIYPNPADTFTRVSAVPEFQKLELYDLHGRLHITQKSPLLDLHGYPRGLYLVRIISAGGSALERLVIE